VYVVLYSNTNHLQVLPKEPGGLQFAQHQRRAEVLTDLGQELAQHTLDKLPQVMVAALAVHTPWKANSSDNTLRNGKKKQGHAYNHILSTPPQTTTSFRSKFIRKSIFSFLAPYDNTHTKKPQYSLPEKTLQYLQQQPPQLHIAFVSETFTEKEDSHLWVLSYSKKFFLFLQLKKLTSLLLLP